MRHGRVFVTALLLAVLGCGAGVEVQVIAPVRESIDESFTEPARTRLEKTYRITTPVGGRIGRIDLEPGDQVTIGQVLAQYDLLPFEQAAVEARAAVEELEAQLAVKDDNSIENTALIEAAIAIDAATEALKASSAQVDAEEARASRAAKELTRIKTLADSNTVTQSELEDAQLAAETSRLELKRQEFYFAALKAFIAAVHLGPRYVEEYIGKKTLEREIIIHQLVQARARLAQAEHELKLATVLSPIDGVVLEKYEQGDSPLSAGQPLLLLGDLRQLEVIADVLTEDALVLSPGSRVDLLPAYGQDPLFGTVKRIEPAGLPAPIVVDLGFQEVRRKSKEAERKQVADIFPPHCARRAGLHQSRTQNATEIPIPEIAVMCLREGGQHRIEALLDKPRGQRASRLLVMPLLGIPAVRDRLRRQDGLQAEFCQRILGGGVPEIGETWRHRGVKFRIANGFGEEIRLEAVEHDDDHVQFGGKNIHGSDQWPEKSGFHATGPNNGANPLSNEGIWFQLN